MSSPAVSSELATDSQGFDTAFDTQVTATRDALKTFQVVTSINASGPARLALEELIDITVRS